MMAKVSGACASVTISVITIKFVEDMVRDIAVHFAEDERVTEYIVESENFESIHNHSAYAQIHQIK